MKLTLRTLLAYLDDILEPSQAKEIGDKIGESPFATTLVNRIREIMRRRRLTAPDLEGPSMGLDPNTVASYLDNTLAPEHVADVEKVCLESDMHLSEVAACHQILAIVLGEPVDVSVQMRERLYALAPQAKEATGKLDVESKPSGDGQPTPDDTKPQPVATADKTEATDTSFSDTIPDYLRPRPVWSRILPYAVCLALLIAFVGLMATDPAFDLFSGTSEKEPGEGTGRQPVQIAGSDQPNLDDQGDTGASSATSADDAAESPSPSTPEAPPVASTDDSPSVADAGDPTQESTGLPDDDAPPVVALQPPFEEPEPAPAAPPADEPVTVQYVSSEGILLDYIPRQDDWLVLPPRALVHQGERIAVPEPFDSVLDVSKGHYRVQLLGGTSVSLLKANEAASFGFHIHRGRLILEPVTKQSITLAVAVGDRLWRLDLLTEDARCAIEVVPKQPTGFEHDLGTNPSVGTLYVTKGSVRIADGKGWAESVNGPAVTPLPLAPPDAAPAEPAGDAVAAPLNVVIPPWLDPEAKATTAISRRFVKMFENEFEPDQRMLLIVPTIAKDDPQARIAEWAVGCLAVTGRYAALVDVLAQGRPEHEEARLEAINGLRDWLPTAPPEENGPLLAEELNKRFRPENVDKVYRLLWGYDESITRDVARSLELVEWMNHPHIAIRELAYYHVFRLTGGPRNYSPLLPPTQLTSTVDRLKEQVRRNEGLLPKTP